MQNKNKIWCRLLIPSKVAGAIIGKGGATIKSLREEVLFIFFRISLETEKFLMEHLSKSSCEQVTDNISDYVPFELFQMLDLFDMF